MRTKKDQIELYQLLIFSRRVILYYFYTNLQSLFQFNGVIGSWLWQLVTTVAIWLGPEC